MTIRHISKEPVQKNLYPEAVAGTAAREGSTDENQQQQRRIKGLISIIAIRARKLGLKYDEADDRRGIEAGEIDVDHLQAHADRLADDIQAQSRRRALGPRA